MELLICPRLPSYATAKEVPPKLMCPSMALDDKQFRHWRAAVRGR